MLGCSGVTAGGQEPPAPPNEIKKSIKFQLRPCAATRNPKIPRPAPNRTETGSGNLFVQFSSSVRSEKNTIRVVRVGEILLGVGEI